MVHSNVLYSILYQYIYCLYLSWEANVFAAIFYEIKLEEIYNKYEKVSMSSKVFFIYLHSFMLYMYRMPFHLQCSLNGRVLRN